MVGDDFDVESLDQLPVLCVVGQNVEAEGNGELQLEGEWQCWHREQTFSV